MIYYPQTLCWQEQELSQTGKEHRLKEAITPVAEKYDYIIIDTPRLFGCVDRKRIYGGK